MKPDLYTEIAEKVPQIARGKVWCRTCRREENVDASKPYGAAGRSAAASP